MQNVKSWLCAAAVLAALGGGLALVENGSARTVLAQDRRGEDHWQYHDGHWSQWNQSDKRWYYTNGNHWFYNDGKAWNTYRFDKSFGRHGFERGTYKYPGENEKVIVPRHSVYVAP